MWPAILGACALALVGWSQWCLLTTTKNQSETFTEALREANRRQAEVVATLVLGYQDSVPTSEASSTTPSENEPSGPDVNNLDDMPDHIREAYLREATEDEMMASRLSTLSSTGLSDSR